MTATASEDVESAATAEEPRTSRFYAFLGHPYTRVSLRWLLIVVLTLVAFWPSLVSLYDSTRGNSLNGYVWLVPLAGVLAAQGVARRPRTQLPIHDRQTDVIVGVMGLVFALLLCGVLTRRYGMWFQLVRFDLLGMWVFVFSCAIVLFGLRPAGRYLGVWVLTLMVFTLPYQIVVIVLGGSRLAAGAVALIIAGWATALAVGRTTRRALVGAGLAWAVGLAVLLVINFRFPSAPVFVYQAVPTLTAIVLVACVMFAFARRGGRMRTASRAVASPATTNVWRVVPLLVAVAAVLTLVKLPAQGTPPSMRFDALEITGPLMAPAGWRLAETEEYPWVKRLHGKSAMLTRQRMVADVGNPQWDKLSRPRTVIVDNVYTQRPFSFFVYPAKVLYDVTATRLSQVRRVDLGYGVIGELMSGVDDNLHVTWNMLQWTWLNRDRAQRILVFTVDNHDDDAPFPEPSGALLPTLNTLLTVLFRGNSAVDDTNPEFKDADLLEVFGRDIVAAQLRPLGLGPASQVAAP